MTSHDEPALHALSVEPRTARAGETVRIAFRTRNLGTGPSPAGTVAFTLGEGLEALDALDVPVEPVEPCEDVVAAVRARVAAPAEDRSEIAVRAELHLPDRVLGTNACTIVVRSRAVLDGPSSGTFVEALDAETVRVRAVVANEGDGPARDVRIAVPAPVGCVRADGDAPAVLELWRMEPGQHAELAFEARIVEPVAEIRADDGEVSFGAGRRAALPARETLALAASIAPPRVVAEPSRRRVDLAIDVTNAGWIDASGVRVRTALPAPLRLVDGSTEVNGVPVGVRVRARAGRRRGVQQATSDIATIERERDAHVVVLRTVPARSTVRVALAAAFPPCFPGATIVVGAGGREVDVPVSPEHVRDVRVRVAGAPRFVAPDDVAHVRAEVVNAGDVTERLAVAVSGSCAEASGAAEIVLQPGASALVEPAVRVPSDVRDGATFALTIAVSDAGGLRANADCSLRVRDRAWLTVDEPPVRHAGRIVYTIRNAGSTPAHGVCAVLGETRVPIGDLAPGTSAVCTVDEGLARGGGTVSWARAEAVALPRLDDRLPASVQARLQAPEHVVAGAAFAVRLAIDAEDDVDRLVVRVPDVPGFRYVAGSASLDGCALLDRCESAAQHARSPLDGDGLVLRDVPAGTRLTAEWSLIADARLGDDVRIRATIVADDDEREVESTAVSVRERDVFAARRAGLPYHVETCVVVPPPAAAAERETTTPAMAKAYVAEIAPTAMTSVEEIAVETPVPPRALHDARALECTLRLDRERAEEITRLLPGTDTDGLVGHLFVLRFFFPDGQSLGDGAIAAALDAVGSALRDTFDRLYVKLRIPGFDVSADDLEDGSSRAALVVLFQTLLAAAAGASSADGDAAEWERERLRGALEACAEASYGAPAVLRSVLALIPRRYDDDFTFGAALAQYVCLLDGALSRYEGLPLEIFDDALAHGRNGALDEARGRVVAALRPHARPLEAAC
ncbi:MAG TPA: hypothetical protein VFF00_00445 [Candidatus Elarobacter sp.]|nr:hypothetical protein [Candidatus Elarobacter sp.]